MIKKIHHFYVFLFLTIILSFNTIFPVFAQVNQTADQFGQSFKIIRGDEATYNVTKQQFVPEIYEIQAENFTVINTPISVGVTYKVLIENISSSMYYTQQIYDFHGVNITSRFYSNGPWIMKAFNNLTSVKAFVKYYSNINQNYTVQGNYLINHTKSQDFFYNWHTGWLNATVDYGTYNGTRVITLISNKTSQSHVFLSLTNQTIPVSNSLFGSLTFFGLNDVLLVASFFAIIFTFLFGSIIGNKMKKRKNK